MTRTERRGRTRGAGLTEPLTRTDLDGRTRAGRFYRVLRSDSDACPPPHHRTPPFQDLWCWCWGGRGGLRRGRRFPGPAQPGIEANAPPAVTRAGRRTQSRKLDPAGGGRGAGGAGGLRWLGRGILRGARRPLPPARLLRRDSSCPPPTEPERRRGRRTQRQMRCGSELPAPPRGAGRARTARSRAGRARRAGDATAAKSCVSTAPFRRAKLLSFSLHLRPGPGPGPAFRTL